MTEPTPPCDTITVTTLATAEVSATHAELFVRIQGSSFFSGQLALTRAREVAQFVGALRELGLAEKDIQLQGVTVSESSGMLSKSSSALYDLKVRCEPLDRLTELLGAITAQKNIQLQRTQWGYDGLEVARETLLDQCLVALGRRAQRIAAGLGVAIVGVHQFHETWAIPESPHHYPTYSTNLRGQSASFAKTREVSLGTELLHTQLLTLSAEALYRVSGFVAPE